MKTSQKRRAFGYIRCSHSSQVENGETLTVQRERIEALCAFQGFDLVEIFADEGVSGGTPFRDRPAGSQLWAAMRPGDVIIALKLDRAFRDVADGANVMAACRKAGYGMILADLGTEDITLGSVSGLVFNLLASVASFERQRCGERIRDARDSLKKRGRYGGGAVPFGHVLVEREGEKFVVIDEAVRDAVMGLKQREFSNRQACVELGKIGVEVCEPALARFLRTQAA